MSLNWSIKNVKDWEQLLVVGRYDPMGSFIPDPKGDSKKLCLATDVLVLATMAIDIGQITEKNVDEVYKRLRFIELAQGALRLRRNEKSGEYEPQFFTREEVVRHIGLSTNVANKPTSSWLARIWKNWSPE